MDRIAIIGAGLIGRAWAIVFARAGRSVNLFDADAAVLEGNLRALDGGLGDLWDAGLISEAPAAIRARITPVASLDAALDGASYVQENVRETLAVKQEIYAAMDRLAGARTASWRARLRLSPPPRFTGVPRRAGTLPRRPSGEPAAPGAGRRACACAVDFAGTDRAHARAASEQWAKCRCSSARRSRASSSIACRRRC